MLKSLKLFLRRVPYVGDLAQAAYTRVGRRTQRAQAFTSSADYWERRYAGGGNSGAGSYGRLAEFKADVLNRFVAERHVRTVTEFGCGDGNQLAFIRYPRYLGLDVSPAAIKKCCARYRGDTTKSFRLISEAPVDVADLTVSLDVIFHLVEDSVFEDHIRAVFKSSRRFVIIYSSDSDDNRGYEGTHVRHRKFSTWVERNIDGWTLTESIPNRYPYAGDEQRESFAQFFIYEKTS